MKALVVLSGGQDSTTCLGLAIQKHEEVEALTFDYGQKHRAEVRAAKRICSLYDIPLLIIDLRPILENMKSSALITNGDTTKPHPILSGLPASFVPARNALFLSTAFGIAIEHNCKVIYTGVCETDYSGYPDCRAAFIEAFNEAMIIGYESDIAIVTPLMHMTKAETFHLASEVGFLATVIDETVTCYDGEIGLKHTWGYGCGQCPACQLRAAGYKEYEASFDRQAEMKDV